MLTSNASTIEISASKWLEKIKEEKEEIKYLGNKTLQNLEFKIKNLSDNPPTKIQGLKNVWFLFFANKSGFFL